MDDTLVMDDFHPDAHALRAHALSATYVDWPGPDGEVYRRVALTEAPGVRERIEDIYGPVDMLGMGYRLNYDGELPNAAIHSDIGWGTHALVLYLFDAPAGAADDMHGTAFWRHRKTGADGIEPGDIDLFEQVRNDWNDAAAWQQKRRVGLRFNRAVMYPSRLFHSRYPFEAFGFTPGDGRLVAVAFFSPR